LVSLSRRGFGIVGKQWQDQGRQDFEMRDRLEKLARWWHEG
jgi:hypothetical protein